MAEIKGNCPQCAKSSAAVSAQTIKHHLKKPWLWADSNKDYYFCSSPSCKTIYFGLNGEIILQSKLRIDVGIKSKADDALICYCFDVNRVDASNPEAKAYVVEQTKAGQCACKTRNPSGRCCLKDFP